MGLPVSFQTSFSIITDKPQSITIMFVFFRHQSHNLYAKLQAYIAFPFSLKFP